jgi:hypothetical protein
MRCISRLLAHHTESVSTGQGFCFAFCNEKCLYRNIENMKLNEPYYYIKSLGLIIKMSNIINGPIADQYYLDCGYGLSHNDAIPWNNAHFYCNLYVLM